ncbi:MAG: metallophosphoesterase, partial [candidate division Zixibacteria bacterium]
MNRYKALSFESAMNSTKIIIASTLLIWTFAANTLLAQDSLGDTTAAILDFDDGPHVYWKNGNQATVFYYCKETFDSLSFEVRDTLRFSGFCNDSEMTYLISAQPPQVEPHLFDNVSRILAVSDIHGEYEALLDILQKAKVIDSEYRWTFGDGHLVVVGDVFDRGSKVTECLWLIYRLEAEARSQGGRVHLLLGNHELMVLRGDNRYIHERYMKGIVKKLRLNHEDIFGPESELGRWLRTKHLAIKINDILYVHGGISPFVVERSLSLKKINEIARASLDISSLNLTFSTTAKFIFSSRGPFWYRGYHYEMENRYPKVTGEEISTILSFYEASAVVVGHSEHDSLTAKFDQRVFAIDVPVAELGGLQALLWQDGRFLLVDVT